MPTYTFEETDMQKASDEWGCNCGPSALAFALQTTLEKIRPTMNLVGFDAKRYTNPTMMRDALTTLAVRIRVIKVPVRTPAGGLDVEPMFPVALEGLPNVASQMSLVRVQWTGPWTQPGAKPTWAYRQTHWIVTWTERGVPLVFDCNGGIRGFDSWEQEIVPILTKMYPRADGGWFPTHIWRMKVT